MKIVSTTMLIFAFIIIFLCECVVGQPSSELDPKKSGAVQAAASSDADVRLAEEITYSPGYTTLGAAIDDLARMSGVTIACGKDSRDWKVRDIPIVISVRNLPLGRLLRLLADSTHTAFICSNTVTASSVDQRKYRIYRSARLERDLEEGLSLRRNAGMVSSDWAWDALSKLAGTLEKPADRRQAVLAGEIINTLGPDTKEQILNGQNISLSASNSPQAALIQELYGLIWHYYHERTMVDEESPKEPTMDEINSARLDIGLNQSDDRYGIEIKLSPVRMSGASSSWDPLLVSLAKGLESIPSLEISPCPEIKSGGPITEMRVADKSLQMLDKNSYQNLPLLQNIVKLNIKKEKNELTHADVITALAESSGLNIICEDFFSHLRNQWDFGEIRETSVSSVFGKEFPIGQLLKTLTGRRITWFINENEKVLVGWAIAPGSWSIFNWRDMHKILVPASCLDKLREELNGAGVDLDDITVLASMSEQQLLNWFYFSNDPDLRALYIPDHYRSLWRLYDSFTSTEKNQAKSEAGLPLASIDPQLVSDVLREQGKNASGFVIEGVPDELKASSMKRLFNDAQLISHLSLRVKSRSTPDLSQRSYYIEITCTNTDGEFRLQSPRLPALPIRSKRRNPSGNTAPQSRSSVFREQVP